MGARTVTKNHDLKPAKAWQDLPFDDFLSNICFPFQIGIQLPDTIEKRINFVHKILELAYYEYQLLDVAFREALLTFELALRIRYTELTNEDSKETSLKKLIDWAINRHLFVAAKHNLHALRMLRNGYFHPNRYQMSLGPMALTILYGTIDNIVDLFHDEKTHNERITEEQRVQQILAKFEKSGFIVDDGVHRKIIVRAILAVFDNRFGRSIYHFIFWPIFDAKWDENNSVNLQKPILLDVSEVKIEESSIILTGKQSVTLRKLKRTEYDLWHKFKIDFASADMDVNRCFVEAEIAQQRSKYRKMVFWPNQFQKNSNMTNRH